MTLNKSVTSAHTLANTSIAQVSLEQLHLMLDHLQAMVGYFDTSNRCLYANHAYARAFNTTVQNMLGKHTREIVGEAGWAVIEPYTLRAMAGEAVRYVREVDEGQHSSRWIEVHIVPNVIEGGEVFGGFVFIDDVSEQYRAEQAIRESDERAERFVQAGMEGIVFYRDGIIFDCNDAFTRMLGKRREDLIGTRASHLFQKKDWEFAEKHMHLGREHLYPAQLPRGDGSLVTVEIMGRPVMLNGQSASVASVRDNSQLASMNEALLRSQSRYRSLVDNSDQSALFILDRMVVYSNPAAHRFFGLSEVQLRGVQSLNLLHPDDRALALMRRKQMIAGDPDRTVVLRTITPPSQKLTPESKIGWVRLHGSMMEWDGRWGVLVFLTDITEMRESQEKMRKSLAQEKELGDLKTRFVSMASHEFRTPLATIQTSSELLEHYNERLSAEERADAVADIQRAVQRMQSMMDSFLAFGRMDAGITAFAPTATSVLSCLQGFVQETRAAQPRQYAVSIYLEPPLDGHTKLMLDQTLLGQMVMNLITNACKYSSADSQVQMRVAQRRSEEGIFLLISVRDQGIGIPEKELPRLFESFYRASNTATIPGTGLGLAIVDRAARAHGGSVHVKSALGQGALFSLLLPWVQAV
ncbi:PAS domain S-box protein [Variovorax sp. PCZ-1]|uniref:sensor histidine kinase n=1 Tax=Variovorax sp. PCZ-1 TaxID=2835533 RepID=UPI001BCF8EC1|nr:PAS domain S-box protein [Variovorax sp. PCZ-1]MBS7807103.1 PAS domain S-box protein [Variovorax sp. PCZ-1]